jgi:shikimate kinase/3-dehydroquinate synthase
MGSGKSAIGRLLAHRLGLTFQDSDAVIERELGMSIAEIFARHGEAAFRSAERRIIATLLAGPPIVLATGGGAFVDEQTRALIGHTARSIWLRAPIALLVSRVVGRSHRPLLNQGDPEAILTALEAARRPIYAQADIVIDSTSEPAAMTADAALTALKQFQPPEDIAVDLADTPYKVLIGDDLLTQAGKYLATHLPQRRAIIVTDHHVAAHYLAPLQRGLTEHGFAHQALIVPAGEGSKSVAQFSGLIEDILACKPERRSAIIALGGGVVGDLAGFAAASALRGLPFAQIPTSLLAQVDSSVGGKTGINSRHGKNLIGAFHQPRIVLIDITTLRTLPRRERAAGYAEILKAGLIGEPDLFEWCLAHGLAVIEGDTAAQRHAISRAVRFKARVVVADPHEQAPENGRALLNLGHSFAHAFEAETGYGSALLHGEAVAIGLVCALHLSAVLGFCPADLAPRVAAHLAAVGLPNRIPAGSADGLIGHMRNDKKMRDGKLAFVLVRGVGQAFTDRGVPEEAVRATLHAHGARDV